jgi:hypothetical protein
MQSKKMPDRHEFDQKSGFQKVVAKQRQKLIGAGAAALALGGGILVWQLFPKTMTLDTSSGIYLLPPETWFSATVATDNERWQKFMEFGIPESRGVFLDTLGKLQTNFLSNYGYDYQRDIQPWIGKQILIGSIYNGDRSAKPGTAKVSQQELVAILPIGNADLAKKTLEADRTPGDANLVETTHKGSSVREIKRKNGAIVSTIVDNFLVIGTSRKAIERIIDTAKSGNSLLKVPGYTKALTEIEISRPFAQVYVNVPIATALGIENAPGNIDSSKIAQIQNQQGIAANAVLEPEGLRWKGISWIKPNSKQKLVVENQSQNASRSLPQNTMMMVSGGNFQKFWEDYARAAGSNPLSPLKPSEIAQGLDRTAGLSLEGDILNWSKGEYAAAIVPRAEKTDTEFSAGLVLLQQAKDKSAAEKALAKLDSNMSKKHGFKITKAKLAGKDVVNWATPLDGAAGTRGWLDNDLAFLTLGAPVASSFSPQPAQRLSDNPMFQLATKSDLGAHNGQFFIDVDRTINVGNIPLPNLPPEAIVTLKAIRTLGVTSAVKDEYNNRFDLFVHLKQAPGIAKLAPPPSPKPATKEPEGTAPKPSPSPKP